MARLTQPLVCDSGSPSGHCLCFSAAKGRHYSTLFSFLEQITPQITAFSSQLQLPESASEGV